MHGPVVEELDQEVQVIGELLHHPVPGQLH